MARKSTTKPKIVVTKKIIVKKGTTLLELPFETLKSVLADVGFAGGLLLKTTNEVFSELKKVAKSGVVSSTDFEKALVNGLKRTNDHAVSATRSLAKRILK